MAACAGGAPVGACLRTFVAWEFDNQDDPEVEYAVAQVAEWIDMWTASDSATRERTIGAWWRTTGLPARALSSL